MSEGMIAKNPEILTLSNNLNYKGKYFINYYTWENGEKKRHRKYGYEKKSEAKKDVEKLIEELGIAFTYGSPKVVNKGILVKHAFQMYIELCDNKPDTIRTKKDNYRIYLDDFYKDMKVSELTEKTMLKLKQYLDNRKLVKPRTKVDVKGQDNLLSNNKKNSIFFTNKSFVEWLFKKGYIKENIINGIKPFRKVNKTDTEFYWTIEDFEKVYSYIKDEGEKYFLKMLFTTGMRRGEGLALRWCDVNFEERTININKTCNKRKEVGSTKTIESERRIYMSNTTKDVLMKWKEYARKRYNFKLTDLLLTKDGCTPYSCTTLDRNFKKASEEAGVKSISIHGLRRSFVTNMCNNEGMNPNIVRKMVGHKRLSTTMNIYYGCTNDEEKEAVNIMDNMYYEYEKIGKK